MLRKNVSRFRKLNFLLDNLLTLGALAMAALLDRVLRGHSPWAPLYDIVDFRGATLLLLVLSAIIYLRGERYVYRLKGARDFAREALTMVLYSASLFVAGIYMLKLPAMPRLQFVLFVTLQFTTLFLLRLVLLKTLHHLRARGHNRQQALVIGTRARVRDLVDTMIEQRQWGLKAVGIIALDTVDTHKVLYRYRDIPLIGSLDRLPDLIKSNHIDYVFFTVPGNRIDEVRDAMLVCEEMGVMVCVQADFIELTASRYQATEFAGKPAIVYSREPEISAAITFKALADRLAAIFGLVVLAPVFTAIAATIKLTSRGPVFFGQERCGLNGKRFRVLKFRTMVSNAESLKKRLAHLNEMDGPVFKIKDDPRITRIGKVLRKLSLDELPQLINVARGDMSLVGPRPPLPEEVRHYDLWQRRKLSMKPGITCLWQVGDRNDSTFDQWMRQDLEYIDNWSLMLDAKILLRTIPAVLNATGR
ncbi:MAG: sugar transferase [Candidatus Zixiibacteriota bacterium]